MKVPSRFRSLSRAAVGGMLLAALAGWAPATPNRWTPADAAVLVDIIEDADAQGLNPRDYRPGTIRTAIASGNAGAIDAVATAAAVELAGDYWAGRVPPGQRVDWHIAGPSRSDAVLAARIGAGLRAGRLPATFAELLPTHPDYRQLRTALAATPEDAASRRAQLRVNMERWRWMPRELGARHILVNVPGFSLKVVVDGRTIDERPVIVGRPATPTPQFSSEVTGVILNPWWEVPKSIVAESVGDLVRHRPDKAAAQGYVVQTTPDGTVRIRQKPGPHNALGQMKLVMPNPFSVYLHDTPGRGKFELADRALSHGCVRVKGAIDFAAFLLEDDPTWNRTQIDRMLASGGTSRAVLARSVPVHIAYFTVAARGDGLAFHGDPYGRDAGVLRALDRGAPALLAARSDICPA